MERLTIRRPDDFHVHLRDGAMLAAVLPATVRDFGRALVMPNLAPPIATADAARAYERRIRAALPADARFTPLMTAYLTDATDADALIAGFREGAFLAAKLYPAHATTNSAAGVTSVARIMPVLERMAEAGMTLCVHGEATEPEIDVFDREAVFIERVLNPLRRRLPELRIVLEHVTTRDAVEFVRAAGPLTAATITPHHLVWSRNALFQGGLRPDAYCLPVLKRETHRLALVEAATSGEPCFFLGTDSAPHARAAKAAECGCAGIYCAPTALAAYAAIFEAAGALDRLETFASVNGARFYRLPLNQDQVTLTRMPCEVPALVAPEVGGLRPFLAGETMAWQVGPA